MPTPERKREREREREGEKGRKREKEGGRGGEGAREGGRKGERARSYKRYQLGGQIIQWLQAVLSARARLQHATNSPRGVELH